MFSDVLDKFTAPYLPDKYKAKFNVNNNDKHNKVLGLSNKREKIAKDKHLDRLIDHIKSQPSLFERELLVDEVLLTR